MIRGTVDCREDPWLSSPLCDFHGDVLRVKKDIINKDLGSPPKEPNPSAKSSGFNSRLSIKPDARIYLVSTSATDVSIYKSKDFGIMNADKFFEGIEEFSTASALNVLYHDAQLIKIGLKVWVSIIHINWDVGGSRQEASLIQSRLLRSCRGIVIVHNRSSGPSWEQT